MAAGQAESPVAQIGVAGHGHQRQLEVAARLLREGEIRSPGCFAEVADHGECAGRVGGVEAAVVEGRAVGLDAADGARREAEAPRKPYAEALHGAVLFGLVGQHQRADDLGDEQRVPRVEQLVAAVDVGFAGLRQAAPVGQHLDVFVGLAACGDLVAHEPHGVVDLAYVVAVVVVGSVAVAEGEALVDGVVHHQKEIVVVFRIVVDMAVQREGVEHVLDVVQAQFAFRAVALVVREQRGADDPAVVGAADRGLFEGRPGARDDRAVDVVGARHVGRDDAFDARFHGVELGLFRGRDVAQRLFVFVLLPLPEARPVPQFAREIAVVAGNLLVGGDLVVELDLGEGQAVEEQLAAFDPGGRRDRQPGYLLRGVVARHVVVLDPAGAPAREIHVEIEPVGDFAGGRLEREPHVGVDGPGVVDPEHDARALDPQRAHQLSEVVEAERRRRAPRPAQRTAPVLVVEAAQFGRAVFAAYKSLGNFRFETDFGVDCRSGMLAPKRAE